MPSNGSDNYNRADSAGSLGANWSTQASSFTASVVSNRCQSSGGTSEMQFSAITPGIDQYAKIVIPAFTGAASIGANIGVILRAATPGTRTFYLCVAQDGGGSATQIATRVAGTFTEIASTGFYGWTAGDVLEARVTGTTTPTIEIYGNGSLRLSYTDPAAPAALQGAGGVGIRIGLGSGGTVTDSILDDFEGGTYPIPAGGAVPVMMAAYRRRR
jgi:hypothetical protein